MSKLLIPAQRRDRIQEYLTIHRIARNADLSQLLNASEATIRRDLEWLETEGVLQRTHGGAMLIKRLDSEAEYYQRSQVCAEEKRGIGTVAATLVEEGDTIFVNSGSTTTHLIRALRDHTNITIITNNLIAAIETGEVSFDLLLLGGSWQSKSDSVAGRFALENLSQIYANKAFIGVDGINLKYGCTVPSITEAELARLMIDRTLDSIIVVADHTKWGIVSNFEVAKIEKIHTLITDSKLDTAAQASLRARSVEILLADKILSDHRGK